MCLVHGQLIESSVLELVLCYCYIETIVQFLPAHILQYIPFHVCLYDSQTLTPTCVSATTD